MQGWRALDALVAFAAGLAVGILLVMLVRRHQPQPEETSP